MSKHIYVSKGLALFLTVTTLVWSVGLGALLPFYTAEAIVSTVATDVSRSGLNNLRLKANSTASAIIKIQFGSNENGKTLTSAAVSFTGTSGTPTWTQSAATSSVLADLATTNGGVQLWKDAGAAGFQGQGTDTQVTLAATPVYGASNAFTITPASAPSLVTDDVYYIVIKTKASGLTNNDAFTATVAADGIVTSSTSPTITAVTTTAITVDTAAPTLDAARTGPSAGATAVPISTFMHLSFNETLDQSTLTPANITMSNGVTGQNISVQPFPDGFDISLSGPPTYTASSRFVKASTVSTGFFQIMGTNAITPQGSYTAPTLGDIVVTQFQGFPPEVGIITNATLTSGTFAINGFTPFGGKQITKFASAAVTGLAGSNTALTVGDIVVANTGNRYDWHIVTAGNNVNDAALRFDGESAVPSLVSGSRVSSITPAATATDNGATADGVLAVSLGDLVFIKIGSSYGWQPFFRRYRKYGLY